MVASQRFMGEAMATSDLARVAALYRFSSAVYAVLASVALTAFAGFSFWYEARWRVHATDPHPPLLVLCALQAGAALLMNPPITLAYCLGRFREVAGLYAFQGTVTPLIGFVVVSHYRTAESLAASTLLVAIVTTMLAYRVSGARKLPPPNPLDRDSVRRLVSLGAKAYPGSVTAIIGNNADKLQVDRAGMAGSLSGYGLAGRVPEQICQLLAPIQNTVYPELTRLASTDAAAFTRAVERNVRFTLVLGSCLILVPCGFSDCILRTWLHVDFAKLPAGAVLVMPMMALYRALELAYGVITTAFFAKGVPHYMLPFSVFNALVTIFATVPMLRWQGIAGVGLMNALIDIVQLAPMVFILKRHITPELEVYKLAGAFAGILGFAGAVTLAIHFGIDQPLATWHPIIGFAAAPFFGFITIGLMSRLHLCPVPERVAARARRFQVRGRPVGAWLLGLPAETTV